MKDFIDAHFSVLTVLIVFGALFSAYLWDIHHTPITGTVDWLEGEMKEVVGAILMGLTTKGVQMLNGSRKSDSPEPKP